MKRTVITGGAALAVLLLCANPGAHAQQAAAARIAFNTTRDGNYEVYVMNADGSEPHNVSNFQGTDWVYAADHRLIIASKRTTQHKGAAYDLYSLQPDGTDLRQVTQIPVYDSYVGIAPDGKRFAVCTRQEDDTEIYIIDGTGHVLARLTENDANDCDPDWSPDGSQIAFRSNRSGTWEIWVMNVDGSSPRQLTNFTGNDHLPVTGYQGEGPPRWSPDGRRIAWASWRDGTWGVHVMNADGAGPTRLTGTEADSSYPSWSPDGNRIAFQSNRDGNYEIYAMNADGSAQTRLTNHPEPDYAPVWVRPVPAAQRTGSENARPALKRVTAPLDDFAWLEGHWVGTMTNPAYRAEAYWSRPEVGVVMGMFRLTENSKTLVVEFFTLRETPDGPEMRVRHFGTALDSWEQGDPIILQLVEHVPGRSVFENPVHTRPKRSLMERTGADTWGARSEIVDDDGTVRTLEVQWRRPGNTN